jgi:hypothetical protein
MTIPCPVDEFVPLPTKAGAQKGPVGYKEMREKANAALRAAALLDKEGYHDMPEDGEFVRALTQNALRRVAENKTVPVEEVNVAVNTPIGAMYVSSILTAYDMEVVKDSKRLRHYVTNKLIIESDNPDARIRMRALELLGKVSDVGLFTERTEITVNNRSTVELENSLRDKLRKLRGTDAAEEARIIAPPIDVPMKMRPAQVLADL